MSYLDGLDEPAMPWTIEPTEDGRILKVTYDGAFGSDELGVITDRILAEMVGRKIGRVLLDCADAHFDVPVLNVYKLPDRYDSRGIERSEVRAAVVKPRDGYRAELFEFYEDVCRNRGYFVKLFADAAAAMEWLESA